jgi:predicted Zn-dependent peptidase
MHAVRALSGGLPVVLDSDLALDSFTACAVVPLSSRHEAEDEIGISHLLEHLVMSAPGPDGTPALSDWVSEVGGQANASTTKESVAYWVRVPPEAATEATGRLADAIATPRLTPELVDSERRVVVQELLAAAADPSDVATERFFAELFAGHPLGRPVGGRAADFPCITPARALAYHWCGLATRQPCVVLVGREPLLAAGLAALRDSALDDYRPEALRPAEPPPAARGVEDLDLPDDADYAYTVLGGRGTGRRDPLWGGSQVLAAAVGGLPGSVLYSRLRGELGMSYQLYSVASSYCDSGAWRVLAGSTPADVRTVAAVVRGCLEDAAAGSLPAAALDGARRQALGALTIDYEDPVARAYEEAFFAVDGLLDEPPVALARRRMAAVEPADVAAAAQRVLDSWTAVTAA